MEKSAFFHAPVILSHADQKVGKLSIETVRPGSEGFVFELFPHTYHLLSFSLPTK